ncbi:MAG TPA: spermidine/putrescine ABC transporter substrate-binding protein [Patescibacteria group bacterium]|nr:spermidine/putrescine ABC transporter substrate-binding protein [Patescibacteria group bacterium]
MTRRTLSPLAVVALIGALVLSACGIDPAGSGDASAEPGTSQDPGASGGAGPGEPVGGGEPEDVLNFANWPLYIDQDDDGNPVTILDFEEATGIDVTYTESIEDNTSFFGTIQPALAGGEDTGYDIIVVTDWMIGNLVRLGYLEKLDVERDIPNFVANADPVYLERSYDPGNQYSVPYQSGITGIAYNPELVDEEITSMAQLLDPELIEKYCGQIGMFIEMRDSMSFAMLYNGVTPADATMEDVEAAQQTLLDQAPCVRGYYGNEYADDLANGSLAITMAWSGDVFQLQFDNPDLQFVVPDEGAILWTDNMAIPKGAEHPNAALAMMDYLYDPEVAAQVAEWVNYITPVPGAKEIILGHADDAAAEGDTETEEYLRTVAESPLVFPTQDMLDRLYSYKVLDEEEERQWNELFQEVVQG